MRREHLATAFVTWIVLGGCAASAQSAPVHPKSPGDIAAASRLIAQRNEDCRQEANRQNLHLLARRLFMYHCKSKR
jgi:hypothetical protein